MDYKISTDEGTQTAVITVRGEGTLVGLRRIMTDLAPGGHFALPRRLWDLREATLGMTSAELEQLAHDGQDREGPEPSRAAVVASGDLEFGLSRLFEVYRASDSTSIAVFRDLDEAARWLEEWNPSE